MKDFFKLKKNAKISEALFESSFELIETLLWENEKYLLLEPHLERLEKSARHFSFMRDTNEVRNFLDHTAISFEKDQEYRVRLTLKKTGKLQLSSLPLDEPTKLPVKVTFSRNKTDRTDEFLYHKTTNRSLYDHNLAKCRAKGFFDIIYRNQQNEITEGTISNIIIRAGQTYFTPPVSCGLLPGTYRSYLLQKENFPLKERVLYKEDLLKADEIFMINSVRKMIPATLAG